MRIRTTLFAGLAAGAALFASTASAAPTAVITDAKGDAKGAQAAYDIVSVTMETTKVSKAKNAPLKDFVVTMELAAAPDTKPGTAYQIFGTNAACGAFFAYVYWSALDAGPSSSLQFGDCGDGTDPTSDNFLVESATVTTQGTKLVFKASAKALPSQIKAGSAFTELVAYTAPTEPVVGYSTYDVAVISGAPIEDAATIDFARGDKTYKYGS